MSEAVVDVSRRDFLSGALAAGAAAVACAEDAATGRAAARRVVIDTHTHFYDPTRPQGVPWPGKGDALLYRTVLPAEWEELVAPLGVTGTIIVEASAWVEDNQWLLDLAAAWKPRPGLQGIVGIVGNLPFGDASCRAAIDRFAANDLFLGVRVNAGRLLEGLDDETYLADLERFAGHDLTLDVNGGPVNGAIDRLATRFPDMRIVVEHMGSTRISDAGPDPAWQDAIAAVARHPNVSLKVSALVESQAHAAGTAEGRVDTAYYEPWLDCVWNAFGMQRLFFGSNWPVSARSGSYADVLGVVTPFVAKRGADAERWFFADASRAAYRWDAATAPSKP